METIGKAGLLFPFVTHSIETGIVAADGVKAGDILWTKAGEAGKVYGAKPTNGIYVGICQSTLLRGEDDTYDKGDVVNVVKKGRLWVTVKGTVTAGSAAYITTDGKIGVKGETGSEGTAITGGTFKSDAAGGKLAELELA